MNRNIKILNIEEVGAKIEGMITVGKVKLSDLFIVIGNSDEADFEYTFHEEFISNLKANLFDKNPNLVQLVNTTKIRVFFSKECIKWAQDNGESIPVYAKYILDHRKFAYPNVSIPKVAKSLIKN